MQRLRAGSEPFPDAMKAFAVRYLDDAQHAGRTMKDVAKELRVSEPMLLAWRRGGERGARRHHQFPSSCR